MARMSFAYILSVLMVAVAACSGGERAGTTTTSSATNDHPPRATVALITHQAPGDTFWDLVRRGAEAAAAKDDIDLRYSRDPDAAAQANLVRSAVNGRVAGIAVDCHRAEGVLGGRKVIGQRLGLRAVVAEVAAAVVAPADLVRSARLAFESGIDGIIATNTTLNRSGIAQRWRPHAGGLSGAPLRPLALQAVQLLRTALGAGVPIVAAGGIDSARHAQDAFDAGADLVQVYTGLIYRGPGLVREIISA